MIHVRSVAVSGYLVACFALFVGFRYLGGQREIKVASRCG